MLEWERPEALQVRLVLSVIVFLACFYGFFKLLCAIQFQNARYQAAMVAVTLAGQNNQLELEVEDGPNRNGDYVQADHEDDGDDPKSPSSSSKMQESSSSTRTAQQQQQQQQQNKLNYQQRLLITTRLWTLMLLNYVLLVYLPGGTVVSVLALLCIFGLTLHSYLIEEVTRRHRYDRILMLLCLLSLMAGALSLLTYAERTLRVGRVYHGPARIVGYDDDQYTNTNTSKSKTTTTTVMRADLRVAWGGHWACDSATTLCQADLQGALCSTKSTQTVDNGNNRRRRRHLATTTQQQQQETYDAEIDELVDEYEVVEEEVDELNVEAEENLNNPQSQALGTYETEVSEVAEEEVEIYDEVLDVEYAELNAQATTTTAPVAAPSSSSSASSPTTSSSASKNNNNNSTDSLESEVAELEKENEALKEQNEALQNEVANVETEEEEVVEEEEEIEEDYYSGDDGTAYYFDDDFYDNSYWSAYDWDSVWGEYACEDLFDSDVEGQDYNPDVAAGQDEWPSITIYGSCRSCQAFLDDYYSTEHFQAIREFEHQAWAYFAMGGLLAVMALFLHVRERMRPAHERAVELLTNEVGVSA